MKNIHIITTNKPSRLIRARSNENIFLDLHKDFPFDIKYWEYINVFITSDEEIKEGDYYLYGIEIIQANGLVAFHPTIINACKKIILTTDQDLINDGVQAIDDDFLEWFVKNPSCEEIDIDAHIFSTENKHILYYQIIIPKEEPKQETLEEAAETYSENWEDITGLDYYDEYTWTIQKLDFINGAKWQQERSYSEEDMRIAYDKGFKDAMIKYRE